eukprot:453274_1
MDVANHKQECNLMMINGRLAWIWLFTTENRAEITIKIVKFVALHKGTRQPRLINTQNEANNRESFSQNGTKTSNTAAIWLRNARIIDEFCFLQMKISRGNRTQNGFSQIETDKNT